MIYKHFETQKINFNLNKIILLYGKNEGLKKEVLENLKKDKGDIFSYEEKEILENPKIFLSQITSKSLFEEKKIVIIKRATDKLLKILENIDSQIIDDVTIFIVADNLEKKSKLRSEFEKNKSLICIPFYPDNDQTLLKLASNFFREKKISLAPTDINLIVGRSAGDRENLLNELHKIELFCATGKKINSNDIAKLTNLSENQSISELVDNCLAKNKRKTLNILNENNFASEDCILITRIFLAKLKKILVLSENFQNNKNIDLTISSAKPPIFWKDKEITKQQVFKLPPGDTKFLIYKVNELELLIKQNINNPINLVTDFILEQTSDRINNSA